MIQKEWRKDREMEGRKEGREGGEGREEEGREKGEKREIALQ